MHKGVPNEYANSEGSAESVQMHGVTFTQALSEETSDRKLEILVYKLKHSIIKFSAHGPLVSCLAF